MASSMDNMKAVLDEKKKRKQESPTGALMENPQDDSEEKEADDKFQELSKPKQKVEDTHTRKTFLVRDDLIDRLNKVSNEKHHGFKTEFINIAIEYGLEQLEDDN